MSPLVRWILAVVLAFVLLGLLVGVFFMGLMMMAFGSDSCREIGNSVSVSLLIAAPSVMGVGVVVAAVLFGLNKSWRWWVGALATGAALGVCVYATWFALLARWCG